MPQLARRGTASFILMELLPLTRIFDSHPGAPRSTRELPNKGDERCVTTAFKTSNRDPRRSATNSLHETSALAHAASPPRKTREWRFVFFREPRLRSPAPRRSRIPGSSQVGGCREQATG